MVDDDSMVVTNVGCCEAMLYYNKGDESTANRYGKEALTIAERVLGPEHPTTKQFKRDWGSAAVETPVVDNVSVTRKSSVQQKAAASNSSGFVVKLTAC